MILSVDTTKDAPAELRAAAALILSLANDRDKLGSQEKHPFPPPHEVHHEISTVEHLQRTPEPPVIAAQYSSSKPRRIADLLAEVAQEPVIADDTEEESVKPRTVSSPLPPDDKPIVRRIPPGVQVY